MFQTFDDSKVDKELVQKRVNWHFNVPYASHRGGIWERLVRSIRRILSAVSSEQICTDESSTTYLVEVERILNNRPLVPVYDDPDCPTALTPNCLLLMRQSTERVDADVDLRDRYTRRWKQGQTLAGAFWKRWIREYLPTLQRRSKWTTVCRDVKIGDLVPVLGEKMSRGKWPMGVVCKIHADTDNHVRKAEVRTANGVILRDIRKLCLLERDPG